MGVTKGKSKHAADARHMLFAEAYISNGSNGRRAYMEVYQDANEDVAAVNAHRLLKKKHVIDYIEKRRAQLLATVSLTTERWYREVASLCFFDPRKLVDENGQLIPLHKLDPATAAAISAIEAETNNNGTVITRVRPHSKTSALEIAGKVLRVFDIPPPKPADQPSDQYRDPRERAKWLAFFLRRGEPKKLNGPT